MAVRVSRLCACHGLITGVKGYDASNIKLALQAVRMKYIPVFLLFVLVVSACGLLPSMSRDDALATAIELATNPPPTPTFVQRTFMISSEPCVDIDEEQVWEVGDFGA